MCFLLRERGKNPGSSWNLNPRPAGGYWQEVVGSVSYTIGSCKMMFPVNYLVYSVNYIVCLLITYLVYSINYLVCLLITTRTNWVDS